MKRKYFNVLFALMIAASLFLLSDHSEHMISDDKSKSVSNEVESKVIVIDAGHGGVDPGKVGLNGELEKDINLQIAQKLEKILTDAGFTVVMTRQSDQGLYEEHDTNRKSTDLANRVKLIEKTSPILSVSIHQNSFTQGSSRGAQVFYYSHSPKGKEFAQTMQETLKEYLKDGNHRMEKANDDYYMLKKTSGTFIIVECGFLSNPEESKLLISQEYQDKIAWAIKIGIERYLEKIK